MLEPGSPPLYHGILLYSHAIGKLYTSPLPLYTWRRRAASILPDPRRWDVRVHGDVWASPGQEFGLLPPRPTCQVQEPGARRYTKL